MPHITKFFRTSPGNPRRNKHHCEVSIATVDFDCETHVDKNDLVKLDKADGRLADLEFLSRCQQLGQSARLHAVQTLEHVLHWGGWPFPTMCGYQWVRLLLAMDVEIYQWFCMPGINVCCRIRNYWVHLFLGSCFAHYTSVAMFVKDEKVYFGSYPGVSIFAWGDGKPAVGSYYANTGAGRVRRSRRLVD
jgi:hypothetical protein